MCTHCGGTSFLLLYCLQYPFHAKFDSLEERKLFKATDSGGADDVRDFHPFFFGKRSSGEAGMDEDVQHPVEVFKSRVEGKFLHFFIRCVFRDTCPEGEAGNVVEKVVEAFLVLHGAVKDLRYPSHLHDRIEGKEKEENDDRDDDGKEGGTRRNLLGLFGSRLLLGWG